MVSFNRTISFRGLRPVLLDATADQAPVVATDAEAPGRARVLRLALPVRPPQLHLPKVALPALPALPAGLGTRKRRRPVGGVDLSRVALPSARRRPSLSFPSIPAGASLPGRAKLPAVALPGGTLSRHWLVGLAGASVLLVGTAAVITPGIQAPAAQAPAVKAPALKAAVAPADPFAQRALNTELRALRTSVGSGESARSLFLLGDGSMGAMIVSGHDATSVMAAGHEVVREPVTGGSALAKDPELNLKQVKGAAPTTVLLAAKTQFGLPASQLASLKLAPATAGSATFLWTATFTDPARTVLYADRDGGNVSKTPPPALKTP